MSRPRRSTTSGRVYLDLQAKARDEGRGTEELLIIYTLERFLYRLSISPFADRLVLKGAMLLAVLDGRRSTRDIDLLAQDMDNDVDAVAEMVAEIASINVDDGISYDVTQLNASVIREQDLYAGVRVAVPATIDRARTPLRVDVNVGDPVIPRPLAISYPSLLKGDPFRLLGYPIPTVLAEKILTMIDRGDVNTRERDFVDVWMLIRRHEIDAAELSAALAATAEHRGSELRGVRDAVIRLGEVRQADWQRAVIKYGLDGKLPERFEDAIAAVASFADPILTSSVIAGRWQPTQLRWQT